MALNLKNEIDRLNNNKEKTKTVAINIDNRLVELGCERAENLDDVPNKMNKIKSIFCKYAKGRETDSVRAEFNSSGHEVSVYKAFGFEPKIIVAKCSLSYQPGLRPDGEGVFGVVSGIKDANLDHSYFYGNAAISIYVSNVNRNGFKLGVKWMDDEYARRYPDLKAHIDWCVYEKF